LEKVKKWIMFFARWFEIFMSFVILIIILISTFSLVKEIILGAPAIQIDQFLGQSLSLIIGIEFIKMLIKHTPGAAIEVLLFAIARQLIVLHNSMLETLFGILAMAGVFAIRKYLFTGSKQDYTAEE